MKLIFYRSDLHSDNEDVLFEDIAIYHFIVRAEATKGADVILFEEDNGRTKTLSYRDWSKR